VSDWKWLEETRRLQISAYGKDPSELTEDELADFVIWNHTALVDELSEFLQEVNWKPWSKIRGHKNRSAAIGELVDAAHFLANLAVAMGCTDEEWEERYKSKMALNAKRQADGYDNTNKCRECGRALDDVAVSCTTERCVFDA
jgi:dUTPase